MCLIEDILKFGKNNTTIQLTVILSPSCSHCYKVFQDAFEMVMQFPEKASLTVLFNINPKNNDNKYKIVVESLFAMQHTNPKKAREALSDWYIKKMRLETWLKKWKMYVIDMKANHQIRLQYDWCLENEFNYTPVIIINDRLFPKEYEIKELKYFKNDFSEVKEALEKSLLVSV